MRIALVGCMLGLLLANRSVATVTFEQSVYTDVAITGPAPVNGPQKHPTAIPVSQSVLFNRECEKWPFTPLPERAMPPPLWCDNAEQTGLTGTCAHPIPQPPTSFNLAEGHKATRVWYV